MASDADPLRRGRKAAVPGVCLVPLLGLAGCAAEVYLGDLGPGASSDAGEDPPAIQGGEYRLDYPAQLAVACDPVLGDLEAALGESAPELLALASGTVELGTPSGLLVVGGAPIAAGFGVASLVLARRAPDLPGDPYVAEVPVTGRGPLDSERRRALLAFDPAPVGERTIGGSAAVIVGPPAETATCTVTYRARLCRDPDAGCAAVDSAIIGPGGSD